MPTQLTPETVERIHKDAKDYSKNMNTDDIEKKWVGEGSYISGATNYALKSVELVEALEMVFKWEFACDGRKFNGNYKEVVKELVGIAKQALDNHKK